MSSNKNPLIKWIMVSGADGVGRILLQILATVIFARALEATDFGLSSLTMVYCGLISILLSSVFEEALIQRKRVRKRDFSNAMTCVLLLALGFVLAINLVNASGQVSGSIATPLLSTAAFYSLIFFADGSLAIYTAAARRLNRFPDVAFGNLTGMFCGTLAGLLLALSGAGVWSLLAVPFLSRWVALLVLVTRVPIRILPSSQFSWPSDLFAFGRWSLATRWLGALTRSLMQTLVTRYFGFEGNGLLNMAIRIVEPLRVVVVPITHNLSMTFFSRKQESPQKFRKLIVETLSGATLLTLPLFVGLASTATLIIWLIAGADWLAAGPIASLLALAVALECSSSFLFTGLLAKGRPEIGVYFAIISLAVTAIAIATLSPFGLIAVGVARVTAELASTIGILALCKRLLGIERRLVITPLAAGWLSCGAMAASVLYITHLTVGMSPALRLPIAIATGVASYAAICLAFRRDALLSAWKSIKPRG